MTRQDKINLIVNDGEILLNMLGLVPKDLEEFTDDLLDTYVDEVNGEER